MARARATARHPQGWSYMVEQLAAAPNRATFFGRMLDLQCKIVAAEYGAIWTCDAEGHPKPACSWPEDVSTAAQSDNPIMQLLTEAATSGFDKRVSHVLRVGKDQPTTSSGFGAHAFVTVMRRRGEVEAVVTTVAHCSDSAVIQSTAPVREVAAGLYESFEFKQEAIEQRSQAQRVRRAMAVLAVSQEASGFEGSCLNLVNELAQQFQCARVSLGWTWGSRIKVVAVNDTENVRRHSEQITLTELAMAECLDQQQPVVYPIPAGAEPMVAQAVVYAHRRLATAGPMASGKHLLSVPLRYGDDWSGVLLFERVGPESQPYDAATIRQLQLIADVLTPHLADRRRANRFLIIHAWHSIRDVAAHLVGPQHVAWKLLTLAIVAAVIYGVLGSWMHRISAPFRIEAQHQRMVSAPFEGTIESVVVHMGHRVRTGQLLAKLETDQYELDLDEALQNRVLYEMQKTEARANDDHPKVEQSQARIKQVQARIDLINTHMERAKLESPIDGYILDGDWHGKVGSVVEVGQSMFTIAPLESIDDLIAVLHVDEQDIDQLRLAMQTEVDPLAGELATRSEPDRRYRVQIDRWVPYARPLEGVNGFEVRCRFIAPDPYGSIHSLRPGMEGIVKLNAGRKRIGWILTHRIVDTVRLWFWY